MKIEFENEKEARDFLDKIMQEQPGSTMISYSLAIDHFKKSEYIKKSSLEQAREQFQEAKGSALWKSPFWNAYSNMADLYEKVIAEKDLVILNLEKKLSQSDLKEDLNKAFKKAVTEVKPSGGYE